jgi:hypothetical protein
MPVLTRIMAYGIEHAIEHMRRAPRSRKIPLDHHRRGFWFRDASALKTPAPGDRAPGVYTSATHSI